MKAGIGIKGLWKILELMLQNGGRINYPSLETLIGFDKTKYLNTLVIRKFKDKFKFDTHHSYHYMKAALEGEKCNVVNWLLWYKRNEKNVYINCITHSGETLFDIVCDHIGQEVYEHLERFDDKIHTDYIEIAMSFLKYGFKPTFVNLLTVIKAFQFDLAEEILKHGSFDLNAKLPWGDTLLTHTTRFNNLQAVQWLILEKRVDKDLKNANGHTGLDIININEKENSVFCQEGKVLQDWIAPDNDFGTSTVSLNCSSCGKKSGSHKYKSCQTCRYSLCLKCTNKIFKSIKYYIIP
eukprot:UN24299